MSLIKQIFLKSDPIRQLFFTTYKFCKTKTNKLTSLNGIKNMCVRIEIGQSLGT